MAVFSYTGTDESRSTVRGTINADSPRQARDSLRDRGIRVRKIVVKGERDSPTLFRFPRWKRFTGGKQWTSVISELAMLLHAGIPMLDALDTMTDQHTGAMRTALLAVRERVAAGESLAVALRSRRDSFDDATIQMVEVGENAGNLDAVLTQVAEFKQRQSRFTDAVTTALLYPAFLVCFGAAAAVFLMTSVLPPLLENLEETLPTLPFPTRIAKLLSEGLLNYRWWWLGGLLVLSVVGVSVVRHPAGRRVVDRWMLRVPVLGPMFVKQGISRIATIIATLSRSGVELTRAFELAERSVNNVVFRTALRDCGTRISAGEDIADALSQSGVFPPLAVRVFSVGQETGKLDEMLFRLADDYDEQVKTSSARITALVEPVLILVLAAMVGFLLLATILPILEAGNVL
ncbi:type II secretion system F family protein [Roseiconus lacunae]|uniref:type II secretion system F family protein n=1 Tax=Roseiconus lacunae TaxID=2605694 RepID=UPI0011F136C7|nr:type II secretion system F family protein [Roseiconus lacunae]